MRVLHLQLRWFIGETRALIHRVQNRAQRRCGKERSAFAKNREVCVCVCVDKGINKISRLECVALHHQQALIRFTVIEKFLISSPSSIIVAERSPSRARCVINSAQLMATRMTLLWVLQELICYKNTENVCMCGYVAHD